MNVALSWTMSNDVRSGRGAHWGANMVTNAQDQAAGHGALDGDSQAERGQRAHLETASREAERRHVDAPVEAEKHDKGDENHDRHENAKHTRDEVSHDRVGEEPEENVV